MIQPKVFVSFGPLMKIHTKTQGMVWIALTRWSHHPLLLETSKNNLEFSVLLLRYVFQQTWQLLGREWSVPAEWEGFSSRRNFKLFLQELIFSAKDILNDPETMAFTGELSKLCWGIVTSDQVQLIIIFDDHHETKVESYLQRWWLLQLSTMMERLMEMFHLGRTSTKYQIYTWYRSQFDDFSVYPK